MKTIFYAFAASFVRADEWALYGSDKCRGLAMEGGGTKGAYEVGALKVMYELMNPIDTAYDVIVGVSIGGINAAIIALY